MKRISVSGLNKCEKDKIIHYFKKKKEIIAIYLFGSCAKGKKFHSNDIDIGILLDKTNQEDINEQKKECFIQLGRILRKDIHPVILNSASEELMRQIFLKGKCLLVNDSMELARFKMFMISKIAEFGDYRNQMQTGFIKKVMED